MGFTLNGPLNLKHITDAERQALNPKDGDMYCSGTQHKIVKFSDGVWKEVQDKDAYYTLFNENWESGDFTAGGWTVVNDTDNKWVVGQADKHEGDYACYISNDGGTTAGYDPNTAQVSHIYKDITVPAGITDLGIRAFWKTVGESGYDRMEVFVAPTSVTPTAGTEVSSSYSVGQFNGNGAWNESLISRGDQDAGNTIRLIISRKNDGSVGTNPGGLFDELYVLYK